MAGENFSISLTAAQKLRLEAWAVAAGINPSGGVLPKKKGVTLQFAANGNVVTFTILQRPKFSTVGLVKNGVQDLINKEI